MKKNSQKFILIFLTVYLLCGLIFWGYTFLKSVYAMKNPMNNYVHMRTQDVKNIFTSLFSEAHTCIGELDKTKKLACEQKVSKKLAITLREEDLKRNEYEWPHDLFFVKKEGDYYYSLGWEGKLQDISSQVNSGILENNMSYPLKFLGCNNKIFKIYDQSSYSCEIYESIYLDKNETGYMVRLFGLREEMDFFLVLLFPVFILMNIAQSDKYLIAVLLSYIIIPSLITLLIIYVIRKKESYETK